jgi:carboxymethylenebutenolidase
MNEPDDELRENDLRRYLVEEAIEDFEAGRLSRRDALKMIGGITGAAMAAQMLDAHAQQAAQKSGYAPAKSQYSVPATDPSVVGRAVPFQGTDGQLHGYLARAAKDGRYPIVLVCHENRGLTPHIEDVTRRVAKAGYVGIAVDLLSREGGTAKHDFDAIPGILSKAPPERHVQDFASGLAFAKSQSYARSDRAGMTGFCFGGGVTWRVAAGVPELRAAVPFYGLPVPAADVPKVNAAVLAMYGERDQRINANIPAIETAMKASGKTFRKIIYKDADHAFHNDTGERYNALAAKAAWDETLDWFDKYLKA